MSDNKKLIGNPDRRLVSAEEDYEVSYLVRKFDLPAPEVKKAIAQGGHIRKEVEKILRQMKTSQ